ncbi:MAG: YraN family protein [bacterium]|nr:YraN family protein [bacterium]
MAKHNETGRLGEDIACKFMTGEGFRVLDRNYSRKWGELDIVAVKRGKLHFVEVKTVSRDLESLEIARKKGIVDGYKPEDNIHAWKVKRLRRVIQTYLANQKNDPDWQFDVVTVMVDEKKRLARVFLHDNVIL